jgi:hypothetical protein
MDTPVKQIGKVSGVGEIRGPDGKLKGVIHFEGTTPLTEEELRRRLQLELPLSPNEVI